MPHSRTSSCPQRLWLACLGLIVLSPWWSSFTGAEDSPEPQLIVMRDGRIWSGIVTRQAGGYFLEKGNGRTFVTDEHVRCVARSLPDAYRLQREALRDPTAADLIALAEWCLSYRLYDEASDELKRALKRDPENTTARNLLQRVQEQLVAPTKRPTLPTPTEGTVTADVQALGGLTKEHAQRFTEKIQPLLMNRCGNAGCHGIESKQEFRLINVHAGNRNSRKIADQNLSALLAQINFEQPLDSPLITMMRETAHGQAPKAVFGGPQGKEQMQMLREWVMGVAEERQAEEARWAARAKLKTPVALPTSPLPSGVPGETPRPAPTTPVAPPKIESDPEPSIETKEATPAHDPFSPAVFNALPPRGTPKR